MKKFKILVYLIFVFFISLHLFSQEKQEPYFIIDRYIKENNYEKAVELLITIYLQDSEGKKIVNKFLNERKKDFPDFVTHARLKIKQSEKSVEKNDNTGIINKSEKIKTEQNENSGPINIITLVELDLSDLVVDKIPEQQFIKKQEDPKVWKIDKQALINTMNYKLFIELEKRGITYTTEKKHNSDNANQLKIKISSIDTGYWSAYPFKSKHAKAHLKLEYFLKNKKQGSFSLKQQVDISAFSKKLTTRINRMLALGELIGERIAFRLTFLVK